MKIVCLYADLYTLSYKRHVAATALMSCYDMTIQYAHSFADLLKVSCGMTLIVP